MIIMIIIIIIIILRSREVRLLDLLNQNLMLLLNAIGRTIILIVLNVAHTEIASKLKSP